METILLNDEQSNIVRGKYGSYSPLEPIRVVEGWSLPIDVIDDIEFNSIREYLLTLPIQEVTFINID